MRALIDSLKDRIAAETVYTAYFGEVTGTPDYPYVLFWTSTGQLEANTLAGNRDLSDRLGVTMVATTGEGVLSMSVRVRRALVGFAPVSDQWLVEKLRDPFDSQPIDYDKDVALPNHGYPAFAVDLYRLQGTTK
jgi:hypothetical protein